MRTTTPKAEQDGDVLIAKIPKARGEEIRIAINRYKGRAFLAVRTWYPDDHGEMKPSNKGINVAIEHGPAVAEAVGQAVEAARRDGLL